MRIYEWKVLDHDAHAVAIAVHYFVDQIDVKARTKGALEVVIYDHGHRRILCASSRPAGQVDFAHDPRVGVFGQVKFLHVKQLCAVPGQEKVKGLAGPFHLNDHWKIVVAVEGAGSAVAQRQVCVGRGFGIGAHLPFNAAVQLTLRRTVGLRHDGRRHDRRNRKKQLGKSHDESHNSSPTQLGGKKYQQHPGDPKKKCFARPYVFIMKNNPAQGNEQNDNDPEDAREPGSPA